MALLMLVCQLAVLDDWNLLPTGLLLYAIGIPTAWEAFSTTSRSVLGVNIWTEKDVKYWQQQRQQDDIQQRIRAAQFEYHVLQRRSQVRIVPMQQKDGTTALYSM